jgi:hypothetical protein
VAKDAGEFIIVCIGVSSIFDDLVEVNDAGHPRQLEKQL